MKNFKIKLSNLSKNKIKNFIELAQIGNVKSFSASYPRHELQLTDSGDKSKELHIYINHDGGRIKINVTDFEVLKFISPKTTAQENKKRKKDEKLDFDLENKYLDAVDDGIMATFKSNKKTYIDLLSFVENEEEITPISL